ncbi:beta strand repeat-containing protein [Roseobacter sp. GAI101]|uniref:beta strand repeat-containing protein n=1 Tax=Roseobacter sp. (strain GAI101) TaxID=391589 RepID=UPI0001871DD1|nr:outer membrane autotransporter barrel [Roseobacter sp. GAI101]EEB82811.1 outer membrane autotransporter barrel [Roseobacter sp. GAI101]
MISFEGRFYLRGARAIALSTTFLLTLSASTAMAQSSLEWNIGRASDDTAPAIGGNGTWEVGGGALNWLDATGTSVDFADGDDATLPAPGGYTLNLATDISVNDLTFAADGITVADSGGAEKLTIAGDVSVDSGLVGTITANVATSVSKIGAGELKLNGGAGGNVDVLDGTLTIDSGALSGAITAKNDSVTFGTIDINGGTLSGSLTNDGGIVTIDGGLIAALTNTTNAASSTTITAGQVTGATTVDGGALIVNGTTNGSRELGGTTTVNAGTFTLTKGDIDALVNSAATDGTTDITVTAGNVASLTNTSGETLLNGGTVAGTTTVTTGTVTVAGGTMSGNTTVDATGVLDLNSGSVATVSNGGTVDISGGTISGLVTNTGTVNAGGGQLSGGLTADGIINANGNTTTIALSYTNVNGITNTGNSTSTLSFGDTFENTGAVNAGTGAVTIQANNITIGAGNTVTGDVTFDGAVAGSGDLDGADITGTVDIDDGDALTNIGTFTNDGLSEIGAGGAGASLSASAITNQDGATINVNANSTLTGTGNTTNNSGIVNVFGGGSLVETTGNYNNLSTGIVNFNDAGAKTFDVQTGVITNEGALNFNAGTTTVNSAGGAIQNNAGGTINVDNGATMDATGDTIVSDGAGAIITVDGTLTVTSVTNQNGAQLIVNDDAGVLTTGVINGAVINSADFDLDGGSVGSLENNGGTADLNGGSITGTTTVADGTVTNAGATLTGQTSTSGTGTFTQTAGTSGAVQNSGGTVNLDGGTAASLENTATAGTSTVTDGQVTGTTTIAGGSVVVNGTTGGAVELAGTTTLTDGTLTLTAGDVAGLVNQGTTGGATEITVTAGNVASLTNTSGETLLNGGTVAGTTTVADGTVTNAGATLTGQTSTSGTGTFTQTAGTSGAVQNSGGTVNLDGGTAASLENTATAGTSTVTDGQVTGTTTIAGGSVVVNGTTGGAVELAGTTTLTDGTLTLTAGDVAGLVNQGTTGGATEITVTAGNVASLTNTSGETLLNGGTVAGTTTVADGTVTNAGATLTGQTSTSGTGTFTQTAGAANGGIANDGGTVNLNGGTTTSFAGNSGDSFMTGGTITGPTTIDGGSFSLSGGTIGNVTNNATFNIGSTVTGNFTNTGTLNATGTTGVITGNLSAASGTLNMQNGDPTSLLTINGDADLNGVVQLDVDLSDGSTQSDTIAVGGALSGNIILAFTNVGTEGDISDIDIFTYGTTNTLSFSSITGLPDTAAFEYFVQDNGAGSVLLQSRINTGITNLAATVGLTQTLVDAVINRPTSPFVSDFAGDKSVDPCGAGTWARMTGGSADVDGSFSDQTTGQSGTSPVSLNYSGLQLGGDFACFDGHYDGWDLAFGGLLGVNQGSTSNNVFAIDPNTGAATTQLLSFTETDILQRYAGVYMTAARGRFFGDLQYRYEATRFSSTNFEVVANRGFDLTDEKYDNRGQTLSGAVGYSWPVGDVPGLSFVSSAGFAFTNNETDTIDLGTDGTLTLKNSKSRIGFISGTLAKSKLLDDEVSILSYFGTATLYNDFGSDREAVFTSPTGTTRDLKISNVGSYGEVSAGLNYVRLLSPNDAGGARQLNAAIRVDARVGKDIDSYALTGQLRLQF